MPQEDFSVAFIGLGEHQVRAHLQHFLVLSIGDSPIRVAGAFDPNPAVFEEYPMRRYDSVEELLADESVDAVFIASPDKYHSTQLLSAVKAGKHVFCEKPMAVTADDMMKVMAALAIAKEENLVVSTCHPRRFDPPSLWLKRVLPDLYRTYGRLKHFDFSFWYHEVIDEWKKVERKLLSDHFGHEIDIFRFLFGVAPVSLVVNADSYDYYETTGVTTPADGTESISFRFSGSRNLKESVYKEAIRLDFEKGAIFLYLNEGRGFILPEGTQFEFPKMDYGVRFVDTNRNFMDAVAQKDQSYLTHDDMHCNNYLSVELSMTGAASWPLSRI